MLLCDKKDLGGSAKMSPDEAKSYLNKSGKEVKFRRANAKKDDANG